MTRLVEHLTRQRDSSRRLLEIVIAQGDAIRRQDVESVLARLGDLHTEMAHRARLELERDDLLRTAGQDLGLDPEAVDLDAMLVGRPAAEGAKARSLSAELRGLVLEVARIHDQNRVLIRQELTFLDHLMRVLSGTPQAGYSPSGWASTPQAARVVDARV